MICNQTAVMRVFVASAWLQRLRGLFFRRNFTDVLLMTPCRAVHTWGMSRAIDIAFLNEQGFVVMSCRGVKPQQFLKCREACAVLERFACEDAWFQPGERVVIAATRETNYENLSSM